MLRNLLKVLPNLINSNYCITSDASKRYNCIAWAAGVDTRFWWPACGGFWPKDAPREETVRAFVLAFATLGYEKTDNSDLEDDFEKIAIYARSENGKCEPTHASRQLSNGRWTSKLGNYIDIEHSTPECVNGPVYGQPILFMRRNRNRTVQSR